MHLVQLKSSDEYTSTSHFNPNFYKYVTIQCPRELQLHHCVALIIIPTNDINTLLAETWRKVTL